MEYVGLDIQARIFSIAILDENSTMLFEYSFAASAANRRGVGEGGADPEGVGREETRVGVWAYGDCCKPPLDFLGGGGGGSIIDW